MLLAVFALPTLTATQLVSVLGETTEVKPLTFQIQDSAGAFVKLDGGTLTVSYLKPGLFRVLEVINPNPASKIVRVALDPAASPNTLNQVVTLSVGNSSYRLYDRSTKPYNPNYDLIIPPGATRRLDLLVQGGEGSSGTVKMRLLEY